MPLQPSIVAQSNAAPSLWREHVYSQDDWNVGNPLGIGESQSFWVSRNDGVRGVAKPAFVTSSDMPRGAHEKIASDLAFLLEINVPPVILWTAADGRQFSISEAAFAQALNWDQHLPSMTAEFRANVAPQLSASVVFHTWIADGDHGGNGGNVLVDAASVDAAPRLAFIDHAFSMSHNPSLAFAPVTPIKPYYCHENEFLTASIAQTVKRVQLMDETKIRWIVDRVPTEYLPDSRRNTILECLLRRKSELAAAFRV